MSYEVCDVKSSSRIAARMKTAWIQIAAMLIAALLSFSSMPLRAAQAELPPLTTVSGNPRLPGKFIWADLVTDDVPKAVKFYSQLFDWQFFGIGNYTFAMNDQRPLAGMFQKQRPDPKT